MSENHVPAWKRIALKRQTISSGDESKEKGQSNLIDDDPLNITTHLSTGNLTKKEKKESLMVRANPLPKKGSVCRNQGRRRRKNCQRMKRIRKK